GKYPGGFTEPEIESWIGIKEATDVYNEKFMPALEEASKGKHGRIFKAIIPAWLVFNAVFGYIVYPQFLADLFAKGDMYSLATLAPDLLVLGLELSFSLFAMVNLVSAGSVILSAIGANGGRAAKIVELAMGKTIKVEDLPESEYLHRTAPELLSDPGLYPTLTNLVVFFTEPWDDPVHPDMSLLNSFESLRPLVEHYNELAGETKSHTLAVDDGLFAIGGDGNYMLSPEERDARINYYNANNIAVFFRTPYAKHHFKGGAMNDLLNLDARIKELRHQGKTYDQAIQQLYDEGILITGEQIEAARAMAKNWIDANPGSDLKAATEALKDDPVFQAGQGWYLGGANPPETVGGLMGELTAVWDKAFRTCAKDGYNDGLALSAIEFLQDSSLGLLQLRTNPYNLEDPSDPKADYLLKTLTPAAIAYWEAVIPLIFHHGGGACCGHNFLLRTSVWEAVKSDMKEDLIPQWMKDKGISWRNRMKIYEAIEQVGEDYALLFDMFNAKDPISGKPFHALLTMYRMYYEWMPSKYWQKVTQTIKFHASSIGLSQLWARNLVFNKNVPWYAQFSHAKDLLTYPAMPGLMAMIFLNGAMWALGVPHFHAILPKEFALMGGIYAVSPMILTWAAGFSQKLRQEGWGGFITKESIKHIPKFLFNQIGSFLIFVSMFPYGASEAFKVAFGFKKAEFIATISGTKAGEVDTWWKEFKWVVTRYPLEFHWKNKPHTIIPVNKGIISSAAWWGLMGLGVLSGNVNTANWGEWYIALTHATTSVWGLAPLILHPWAHKPKWVERLGKFIKDDKASFRPDVFNIVGAFRDRIRTQSEDVKNTLSASDQVIQAADERKVLECYLNLLEGYYTGKDLGAGEAERIAGEIYDEKLSVGEAHYQVKARGIKEVTRIMFEQFTDLSEHQIGRVLKDIAGPAIQNGNLGLITNELFSNIDTAAEFNEVFTAIYRLIRGTAPPLEDWNAFRAQYLAQSPENRRAFFENKIAEYQAGNTEMIVQAIALRYLERELSLAEINDWSNKWKTGKFDWEKYIRPHMTGQGAKNFVIDTYTRAMGRRPSAEEISRYSYGIRLDQSNADAIPPDFILWDNWEEIETHSYENPAIPGWMETMPHFWRLALEDIAYLEDIKAALDAGEEIGEFPGTLEQAREIQEKAEEWLALEIEISSMTPKERLLMLTKFAQARMKELGIAGKLTDVELRIYGRFEEFRALNLNSDLMKEFLEYLDKYLPDEFLTDEAIVFKQGLLDLKAEFEIVWENLENWDVKEERKQSAKRDIEETLRGRNLIENTIRGGLGTSD
ncbi:MAG: hypothetical protein U9R52_01540, partial [Candidatus Omnitrophota bacterium]|nr:hypothetical protein [Candidatus Omnitrophota bacterium]